MTARTAIPVTPITRAGVAGVAGTASDVSNGNSCVNNGKTWLEVTNTDTAAHPITIQPTRPVDGILVAPVSHTIPLSTTVPVKIGPFSTVDYGTTLEFNGANAGVLVSPYTI